MGEIWFQVVTGRVQSEEINDAKTPPNVVQHIHGWGVRLLDKFWDQHQVTVLLFGIWSRCATWTWGHYI